MIDRIDFSFLRKPDVRFYHQMSMHKQFPLLPEPGAQASDGEAPQGINKFQVCGSSKATWEPPEVDV